MRETETIAAISTALGNGGIHIIRISGPETFHIIDKVFKKGKSLRDFCAEKQVSHTIHYGYIVDNDVCLDEVMVSLFVSPNSYTTEDVAEINCHGGSFVAKNILEILVKNGVRIAAPGEFTKRAFLNGRIDLTQAESIMDIIQSENNYALKASMNHLRGNIKNDIELSREKILHDTAFIEAALDDPEHYSLDGYAEDLSETLTEIIKNLVRLSDSYDNGKIIKEGIDTAIIGKPNVGKSSFLNYIMKEDKAIVTDIPGTTRDIIEQRVSLEGIVLNLMDTAGIHKTEDFVESIGVKKSLKAIEEAELIICMFDASRDFDKEDEYVLSLIREKKAIILINKYDIAKYNFDDKINNENNRIIYYSTVTGQGYKQLSETIEKMFFDNVIDVQNETYITNIRHKEAINNAINSLNLTLENVKNGMPEDLFTIDLMDAYNYLGEITGETVSDSLIDKIFSEFCMGK